MTKLSFVQPFANDFLLRATNKSDNSLDELIPEFFACRDQDNIFITMTLRS